MRNTFLLWIVAALIFIPSVYAQQVEPGEQTGGAGIDQANQPPVEQVREPRQVPVESKPAVKSETFPRWMFMTTGGFGMSISSGDVQGATDGSTRMGRAVLLGIKGGYRIFPSGAVVLGMDYLTRQFIADKTLTSGENQRTTVDGSHVLFSAGYRHTLSFLYMEGGFFFGVKPGVWTRRTALDGDVTTTQMCGPYKNQSKNDGGLYCDAGVMAPVNDSISVSFGVKLILPFVPAYSAEDKLRGNACLFTVGCMYSL